MILEETIVKEKIKNWQDKKDRQAMNALWQHCEAFAKKTASKFARNEEEFHDLMGHAAIAVVNAATKFDTTRKIKFITYAGKAIQNNLHYNFNRRHVIPEYADDYQITINQPITEQPENTTAQLRNDLRRMYQEAKLTPEEIKLIEQHYAGETKLKDTDKYKAIRLMNKLKKISRTKRRKITILKVTKIFSNH